LRHQSNQVSLSKAHYHEQETEMAFAAAKAPKSLLGFHRLLAPSAAVRVSPLCLGGMGFGDAWYVILLHLIKLRTKLTSGPI